MDITADSTHPERGAEPPLTPGEPTEHAPWGPRDVLFGAFWFIGIFLGGQFVVVPPYFIWGKESGQLYTSAFVIGAIVELMIVAVAANFTFRRYGGGWQQLGLRPPSRGTVAWAAGAFAAAMTVTFAYGAVIEIFNIDVLRSDCAEQIPRAVRDQRALLALASLTVIAFAPPCEELFFRGFVFTGLKRGWGLVPGIIVSGLLFAGAHLLYKSFIPILGVGIIFAYTYYRSRNIISTMIAHTAFNSLSIAFIAAGSCDTNASSSLVHWWPL